MIVFEGPPGAGKSVQASMLQERANVVWLSVGKLLRESDSDEVAAIMKRGELINDDLVHSVLEKAINEIHTDNKVLIDGFPRRQSQLDWFLDFIQGHHRTLERVVHLYIPREEAVERLSQRGRLDDSMETINSRYDQYDKEVLPLLKTLGEEYSIAEIDGMGTVEEIHRRVVSALDGIINVYES